MIKVFDTRHISDNPWRFVHIHSLLPELETDYFTYTEDATEAELMFVLPGHSNEEIVHQISTLKETGFRGAVLLLTIFHTDESDHYVHINKVWNKDFYTNVITTNHNDKVHIFLDWLLLRQQLYFKEFTGQDLLQGRMHTFDCEPSLFELESILEKKTDAKRFLAPMRIYGDLPRSQFRKKLQEKLKDRDGLVSDHENGVYFEAQGFHCRAEYLETGDNNYASGTWMPIHNKYYQETYASLYIETITYQNRVKGITEKTWDPIVKGHYVLPFGYRGMIEDLKKVYGLKLPKWIDYSYDKLSDWERFDAYMESVDKFLALDMDFIKTKWEEEKHNILQYNKDRLLNLPFPKAGPKVLEWFNAKQ